MSYIDTGGEFINVDNHIVERKALEIVEAIKLYDPNIEVVCLNPEMASPFDEPFLICERRGDQLFKIFGCWELNELVLTRIKMADAKNIDIQKLIDDTNEAARKADEKRELEQREATKEKVAAIVSNPKSSYSIPNDDGTKTTFYEDRPAKRE